VSGFAGGIAKIRIGIAGVSHTNTKNGTLKDPSPAELEMGWVAGGRRGWVRQIVCLVTGVRFGFP
jgi:hypothetical protein